MTDANYNKIAGEKGEKLVFDVVRQTMNELGYGKRIYTNCFLQYNSVFGEMTTEIDIVTFTPNRIYIIEVKNARFSNSDYLKPQWKLANSKDEKSDLCCNPLLQNHNHKLILCEALRIPLEIVTTIEVLLINGKDHSRASPYPNDYVLDQEELHNDLRYILVSQERSVIDLDQVHEHFLKRIDKVKDAKDSHEEKLHYVDNIRNHLILNNHHLFKRTDHVICPFCRKEFLRFDSTHKNKEPDDGNGCAHESLILNCNKCGRFLNYGNPNDLQMIRHLKALSIEKRNNWTMEERKMKTVMDEVNQLWAEKILLIQENKGWVKDSIERKEELRRAESENDWLRSKLEKSQQPSECCKCLLRHLIRGIKAGCIGLARVTMHIFKRVIKFLFVHVHEQASYSR